MGARSAGWVLFLCTLSTRAVAAESVLVFEGEVPAAGPDHFFIPFAVPSGTLEIEVRHDDLSEANILDWGLSDQNGFRGWGGGNTEPAIVGLAAASRSYVPGPIEPGEWRVVVGKAKIAEQPARYRVEVVLRDSATLSAQTERRPYVAPEPLRPERRWYAGDFHVHSRESGDARPTIDEIAAFARGRGLDFVMLSDHNTLAQLDFLVEAQQRHGELLLLPGMEYTTYAGHANAIGATRWVDHKIGQPGVTLAAALSSFQQQGALVSINHPVLDIGELCIGCAWKHDYDPAQIDAVEVATTGWDKAGQIFDESAISFWDALCARGHHVAAIGGSDDHRAGVDLGAFDSPVGDPTTMVEADGLSVAGILQGVRTGRTVVKLQGPLDPMIELTPAEPSSGDTVRAANATLRARVTGGAGLELRFVQDGAPLAPVTIDSDPFEQTIAVAAPEAGETRVRAEVLVSGKPRTVTSHFWVRAGAGGGAYAGNASPSGGCGCRLAGTSSGFGLAAWSAWVAALLWRKRATTARRGVKGPGDARQS
jgi:hypothetical protein